jgi:hypothetical protein
MPDVDGAFGRLFASRAFALALRAFAPFVALMLRLLALAVRTKSQLTRCVAVNVYDITPKTRRLLRSLPGDLNTDPTDPRFASFPYAP